MAIFGKWGKMGSVVDEAARQVLVRRIRLEMAKQGLTREDLAEKAGVKDRTLGNLLAGEAVRDITIAKIARALAFDLEALLNAPSAKKTMAQEELTARASEAYGGYMRSAYDDYIGIYVAWRRAFARRPELYRSVYEFDWDDEGGRLRFLELQRFRGRGNRTVDSTHAGGVYISPHTGLIQLLTTFQGALRLVTLSRMRLGDNRLRGLILTQSDREQFFAPAAAAIQLDRLDRRRPLAELERLVGPVSPSDPEFAAVSADLAEIEQSSIYAGAAPA